MTNKKVASEIAIGIILIIAIVVGGIFWLQSRNDLISNQESQKPESKSVGMANPASVFCEKNGGKSEIVNNADGSQGGNCVLENGSKCEEWAYFRGECKPEAIGQQMACTMEAKLCTDGKTYVSRIAPNCEFAECPVINQNEDTIDRVFLQNAVIDVVGSSFVTRYAKTKDEAYAVWNKKVDITSVDVSQKAAKGKWWAKDAWDWIGWQQEDGGWKILVSFDGFACDDLKGIPTRLNVFFKDVIYSNGSKYCY